MQYTQWDFQEDKFIYQPHFMIYNTNSFMDNFLTFNADTIVGITLQVLCQRNPWFMLSRLEEPC